MLDATCDLLGLYGVSVPGSAGEDDSFLHLVQHLPAAHVAATQDKLLPLIRQVGAVEMEPVAVEDYDLTMRPGQSLGILQRVDEAKQRVEEDRKRRRSATTSSTKKKPTTTVKRRKKN
jgi:hypothetical protein